MTAGSMDARLLFESVISRNPDHEFVLVGRSNYSQLTDAERAIVNEHGNVIDLWADFTHFRKVYSGEPKFLEIEYMEKVIAEMKPLDAAVFLAGGTSRYSVAKGAINMSGLPLNVMEATKMYHGPITYFLNDTNVPYVLLVTDPRCFPEPFFDTWNIPKKVISQYKEKVKISHRTRYDSIDLVDDYVETEYRGIETMYTIEDVSKKKDAFATLDIDESPANNIVERDIRMALFLNEGKPSRYNDVMKYVFHADPDTIVYGQWNAELLESDDRFKAVAMSSLTHMFDRIKYTFCIPIKKGWATGKFWEMASMGIVPFVHPDYDTQCNIGFPEFLRVTSPDDLKEKMEFLDFDKKEYHRLLTEIKSLLKVEYMNGDYINDVVMSAVKEII